MTFFAPSRKRPVGRPFFRKRERTQVGQLLRLTVITLVAVALATAVPAAADPTPPPSPYQIPTPNGPVFPGIQTYQPVCLTAPLACGFHYDPGRGTWNAPPPSE